MKKFFDSLIFYRIYTFIFLGLGLLAYFVNFDLFLSISLVVGILTLYITKKSKYVLPSLLNFVYSISTQFKSADKPVFLIVVIIAYIFMLFIYALKRKNHKFRFGASFIPLIVLSVINIMTIFWSTSISEENSVIYLLYFAWFGYTLIYLISLNIFKKISLSEFSIAVSSTALLIAAETIKIGLPQVLDTKSLIDGWSNLGWGIANEAGIVMLVLLPFSLNLILRNIKNKNKLFGVLDILITGVIVLACLVSGSRGTLLFLPIEIVAFLYAIFRKFSLKIYQSIMLLLVLAGFVVLVVLNSSLDVKGLALKMFYDKGRMSLFMQGFNSFRRNYVTFFIGSGIGAHFDSGNRLVVYHSTIYQTLAQSGIIGAISIFLLIVNKYRHITNKTNIYTLVFCCGFIAVDLYGLIDNTYHMYYYMIPLLIIMAFFENLYNRNYNDNEQKEVSL